MNSKILTLMTLAFLSFSAPSHAQPAKNAVTEGYTKASLIMRSGPAAHYKNIGKIPTQEFIIVKGCIADLSWCNVITGQQNGWLTGRYIEINYKDKRYSVEDARKLGLVKLTPSAP